MGYTKGEWGYYPHYGKDNKQITEGFISNDIGGCIPVASMSAPVAMKLAEWKANVNLMAASKGMYEALKEILDITHNHATGISKYVGHQKFGNLVVYEPELINRIGNLCRTLTAKAEGGNNDLRKV